LKIERDCKDDLKALEMAIPHLSEGLHLKTSVIEQQEGSLCGHKSSIAVY
jgi:hypothetical protein